MRLSIAPLVAQHRRQVKSLIGATTPDSCIFALGNARLIARKRRHGRVAEWSIAAVLKTADAQVSVGSNPTPSAIPACGTSLESGQYPGSIKCLKASYKKPSLFFRSLDA
jgi:hypothetical protein